MRLIDADALIEDINVWFADSYHLIDSVKERIDAAPTIEQPHWVSCSERLPQDDVEVFVYLFDRQSPYIAWVSDGHWYTEEFEVETEDEPVAFMPLPEPYRRVNRND